MREMKDSGIEWIGEIPKTWTITILSALFSERKCKNSGLAENNLLSLSYGNIVRKNIESNEGLLPASFETYNIIEPGNIVFRLTDLQNDKRSLRTGLCKERGIITSAYVTLQIRSDDSPRYMHYLFHTYDLCKVFYGMGDGVRQGMNYEDLKRLRILRPDQDTQRRIADYLDHKCSQIDTIIARQQQVIEKLKAYKLSVITEAVTKGLNPNVPMKDSGVEWIGEIPEHWTVSALRYGLENIQTGPFGSQLHAEDYIEDGIFVINPANIVEGCIVPDNRCSVTELKAQELSRHILNKGDIIFARRGEMGRCAYFGGSFQQYLCGTGCIKIQCNANLMPEFISWFLQTSCVKQYLTLNSVGTTMANLNTTIISGIPVVFPPISEQEKVVEYIKNKICEIDCVLKNKLSIVEKLTEYKKSLIYEVVTGKKEV